MRLVSTTWRGNCVCRDCRDHDARRGRLRDGTDHAGGLRRGRYRRARRPAATSTSCPSRRTRRPPEDTGTTPGDDSGSCTQKVVINEVKTGRARAPTTRSSSCTTRARAPCRSGTGSSSTLRRAGARGSPATSSRVGDSIPAKGFLVLMPGGSTTLTDRHRGDAMGRSACSTTRGRSSTPWRTAR